MALQSSLSKLYKLDKQPVHKLAKEDISSTPIFICRYCNKEFIPKLHSKKIYCCLKHSQLYRQLKWRRNKGKEKLSQYNKVYRERLGDTWNKYHRIEVKADREELPKPHLRKENWVNKEEVLPIVRESNGRFI